MNDDIAIEPLRAGIERFSQARLLVLGDVMLDKFVWGRVSRISPEAPVPVVEVQRETFMLGGAANVAHNLVALGARAEICGLVGDDEAGRLVRELLEDLEVDQAGVITSSQRPTSLKTRVVAHSQQVVRVDRESRGTASSREAQALWEHLSARLGSVDALIVSDYAKGVICRELMERLMPAARTDGLLLAVDPKVGNMPLYQGATLVTPNHLEAAAAAGVSPDEQDYVAKAGGKLLSMLGAKLVLVTQGERGMTLISPEGQQHIPTTAKQVFDVTGAGDTVISTLTLGLAAGLEPSQAAVLANIAAGEVVGQVGTSVVTAGRLMRAVEEGARLLGSG